MFCVGCEGVSSGQKVYVSWLVSSSRDAKRLKGSRDRTVSVGTYYGFWVLEGAVAPASCGACTIPETLRERGISKKVYLIAWSFKSFGIRL